MKVGECFKQLSRQCNCPVPIFRGGQNKLRVLGEREESLGGCRFSKPAGLSSRSPFDSSLPHSHHHFSSRVFPPIEFSPTCTFFLSFYRFPSLRFHPSSHPHFNTTSLIFLPRPRRPLPSGLTLFYFLNSVLLCMKLAIALTDGMSIMATYGKKKRSILPSFSVLRDSDNDPKPKKDKSKKRGKLSPLPGATLRGHNPPDGVRWQLGLGQPALSQLVSFCWFLGG